MSNRKKATEYILDWVNKFSPGNKNVEVYKNFFSKMNDDEFHQFIQDLKSGNKFLVYISPNFDDHPLTIENNLKMADELGYNFFQKIWMGETETTPSYLTPVEYMVVKLPIRRPSQLLIKKIKVPEHNKTVDMLTKQPTGESKGSRISFPELRQLAAMGLDNCITEMIKYRGGDQRGYAALNGMISKYGKANLKVLSNYASGVESTQTLKSFLTAMMLRTSGLI